MARSGPEVADVFRRYGAAYRDTHGASLCTAQRRVMSAIELCRTAALGGHVERCDHCDHRRVFYNSCRDRHCPNRTCVESGVEHRQIKALAEKLALHFLK